VCDKRKDRLGAVLLEHCGRLYESAAGIRHVICRLSTLHLPGVNIGSTYRREWRPCPRHYRQGPACLLAAVSPPLRIQGLKLTMRPTTLGLGRSLWISAKAVLRWSAIDVALHHVSRSTPRLSRTETLTAWRRRHLERQ
jgi:hypothetical protein